MNDFLLRRIVGGKNFVAVSFRRLIIAELIAPTPTVIRAAETEIALDAVARPDIRRLFGDAVVDLSEIAVDVGKFIVLSNRVASAPVGNLGDARRVARDRYARLHSDLKIFNVAHRSNVSAIEQTLAVVIGRHRYVLDVRPLLIQDLLHHSTIVVGIAVVRRIDRQLSELAQLVDDILNAALGSLEHRRSVLHVLHVLFERSDLLPHHLADRKRRRIILSAVDLLPARHDCQRLAQLIDVLVELAQ